jgi:very-short-patch-repair endonuclease
MTRQELGAPPPSKQVAKVLSAGAEQQAPPPPLAGEGREGALHRSPTWKVKPKIRVRARALRQELTKAERIIWYGLRAHRLDGAGFRRQTPIGRFTVDFACHDKRLVIEVDGGQHADNARDAERNLWLASKGYRVLRFWNNDVLRNSAGVLEMIATAAAEATPLPNPPPQGGRGPSGVRGADGAQS